MLEVTYLDHDTESTVKVIASEVRLVLYQGRRFFEVIALDGMSFVIDDRDLYKITFIEYQEKTKTAEILYPNMETIISGRRIGKRDKKCSRCEQSFYNDLPWNAKYCPNCGARFVKGGEVNA